MGGEQQVQQIRRGDIFYVGGGYATGSEQHAGRPAIVVSNDKNNEHSSTVEMVYLTTRPKRDMPTHVQISSLSRASIAICEQITTVAIERIGNYHGRGNGRIGKSDAGFAGPQRGMPFGRQCSARGRPDDPGYGSRSPLRSSPADV